MTRIAIGILLTAGLFGFSQETATVDDMHFTMVEDVWVHDALPDEYDVEERFSAVHNDEKWQSWYESGNDRLRAVLDLGVNIAFMMVSAEDNQQHVFTVWENDKRFDCAVDNDQPYVMGNVRCPKVGWWVKAGIPAGAVIVGAIIVDDNSVSDEASPIRKQ